MSGLTPQQRTRNLLTEKGWLVGSVERRKKFPDRKKHQCGVCGNIPMIEISEDLWNVFDLIAVWPDDYSGGSTPVTFVQTTSRNNHSTRRNKILCSMEAKLVLLSGCRILIQSWRQNKDKRWEPFDEWITLAMYDQAPHYPNTVAGLQEIKRKAKRPPYPPGTSLHFGEEVPF